MPGRLSARRRARSPGQRRWWIHPDARGGPHDAREDRLSGQGIGQQEIQAGPVAEGDWNSNPAGPHAGSQETVHLFPGRRCPGRSSRTHG